MRFFLELTQHIPPKGCQYIRRYGLYASRSKAKWPDKPHVMRLAPAGWKKQQQQADQDVQPYDAEAICAVSDKESPSTWARLIAQVYEVDPLTCSRCGSPMRILAVITEPEEVRKILRHLMKTGRSPPGLDPTTLKQQSVSFVRDPGDRFVPDLLRGCSNSCVSRLGHSAESSVGAMITGVVRRDRRWAQEIPRSPRWPPNSRTCLPSSDYRFSANFPKHP